MEDERLDLSSIDPLHDPSRWESVMQATMKGVDAALAAREDQQQSPLYFIASWRRTLLAAAAGLLAVLIPAEIALELREQRQDEIRSIASMSISSAATDTTPTGSDILRAIAVERTQ